MRYRLRALAGLAVLLAVGGCAGQGGRPTSPQVSPGASPEANAGGGLELGTISVPAEIEHGLEILPAGEYRVFLYGDGFSAELSLVWTSAGVTYDYGLETNTEELPGKAGAADTTPALRSAVAGSGAQTYLELTVETSGFVYYASLPFHPAGEPVPFRSLAESGSTFVETEIDVIRKVHELLEREAFSIWPEWQSWRETDFLVDFPDGCSLAVTTRERLPARFRPVAGLEVAGKRVYIDASSVTPLPEGTVLSRWHGQGDITGLRMYLMTDEAEDDGEQRAAGEYGRFVTYVHEALHCEQARRAFEADKRGLTRAYGREADPSLLQPDTCAYAEIEGKALLRAYAESDDAQALALLGDAFVARSLKQAGLPEGGAEGDKSRTLSEGTATYAMVRCAMADGGEAARAYAAQEMQEELEAVMADTAASFSSLPYSYGMYWALLLDRFSPEWKVGLLERCGDLDQVVAGLLALSPAEEREHRERLETAYPFDSMRTKYQAVFARRDEVVAAFATLTGVHYTVDVSDAWESFNINPREFVSYGATQYYPRGLLEWRFGSCVVESDELPLRFLIKRSRLEWYDSTPGARYTLTYKTRDGTKYTEVAFAAGGVRLTAAEAEIVERDGEVVLRVLR